MNIKKIFKGLTKEEATEILNQCGLSIDELSIAISVFAYGYNRLYTCDTLAISLGKYHYMLNRVIPKIENVLKLKLFCE